MTRGTLTPTSLALLTPTTADRQRREGFQPRKDCDPWPLKVPLDWSSDPFDDRNWAYQLHAWRMMDPLLKQYRSKPSESLLKECLTFAEDWHEYHVVNGNTAALSWHDMAAGLRTMRLAFLLERIRCGNVFVDDNAINRLQELASIHLAKLTDPKFVARNNHGLYQMAGLRMLAVEFENAEASRFAEDRFMKLLRRQYTDEGVHRENSPDYHFQITRALEEMRADDLFGGFVAQIVEKAKGHRDPLVFPDGSIARAGDSGSRAKAAPSFDGVRVDDLTSSGYAAVRTNDSMLFVTGMAHEQAHKHADELSFQLFHKGRFIFVDSGKYGYKFDAYRRYIVSAAAHNTIGLSDRRIDPTDIEMSGSLLLPIDARGDTFRIEGNLRRPRLFAQRRVIEYRPDEFITITDNVRADSDRSYVSSLHLAPDLQPVLCAGGFKIILGDGCQVIAQVLGADRVDVACGQDDPLLGWYSTGYLTLVPTTVVRAHARGRNAEIVWKISLT